MSLFKRITATVNASVERVVGQLENHDAVVEVALREGREAVARAKVRLARVRRDREGLEGRLDAARSDADHWRERARASAADEATALECLRRRRTATEQATELAAALARQRDAEAHLAREVAGAEARLATLAEQRNLMRTRESMAQAMGALATAECGAPIDVEGAFERWEVKVLEAELSSGAPLSGAQAGGDPLARRFEAQEDDAALRAELAALVAVAVDGEVDHER